MIDENTTAVLEQMKELQKSVNTCAWGLVINMLVLIGIFVAVLKMAPK